jgi:hypothetical protein
MHALMQAGLSFAVADNAVLLDITVLLLLLLQLLQENEELAALTEHFDRVDANAARVAHEEAALAAIRAKVTSALTLIHRAASTIQVMTADYYCKCLNCTLLWYCYWCALRSGDTHLV